MNLRIEDFPLSYTPARGRPISLHLSYRQRGVVPEDPDVIFGVGPNWSCSFRAYVVDAGAGAFVLHRVGAGVTGYALGAPVFRDWSVLTTPDSGTSYQVGYRDGSTNTFGKHFLSGTTSYYFLTARRDPAGNTVNFHYAADSGIVRLDRVEDPDSLSTHLYYENAYFPLQITKVVDPFNRTNLLYYDSEGYLTNIVDAIGMSSQFAYDADPNRTWITNMVTPYGSTSFRFGGVDAADYKMVSGNGQVNRFVEVTLPGGGKELHLYRKDCSGFMSSTYSPEPKPTPLSDTLDNVDQENRNSFYWSALQYGHLSTNDPLSLSSGDYLIGRLRHWLQDSTATYVTDVLSLERAPSPDGSAAGQLVWYDFDGKVSGNNRLGTNALPSLRALILPDGSTNFQHFARNTRSAITQTIATYSAANGGVALRTNTFIYAANDIDLKQQIGPNGEQVITNY